MYSPVLKSTLIVLFLYLCIAPVPGGKAFAACLSAGQWASPTADGAAHATVREVMARTQDSDIVLLGEAHDKAEHHLWQLQSLAMLLGRHGDLVIGMEMFPRRVQSALDQWINGELSESRFLELSDWDRVWRFDPELYLPILRFARMNKLRVVALNVERSLIAETGARGWDAVPIERREGIGDPEPAAQAYREILRSSFHAHAAHGSAQGETENNADDSDNKAFEYFVQAQLVWDRAFAEGLASASAAHPDALVVGIIGSGHLRYGDGVTHQLRALGVERSRVWLPVSPEEDCEQIAGIADAVFAVTEVEGRTPPRLGVYLLDGEQGVEIGQVVDGSVASDAGLKAGDRIVSAAGVAVSSSGEMIAIVRNQQHGTWLPITITREGEKLEIVARFPALVGSD